MTKLEKFGILLFLQSFLGAICVLIRDHQIDIIGGIGFLIMYVAGAIFFVLGDKK